MKSVSFYQTLFLGAASASATKTLALMIGIS